MDSLQFLFLAKLLDWPTIVAGIAAGFLAWSRWGVAAMTLAAAVAVEVILMQVRGWPIRPSWLGVGVAAVLPWVLLGFAVRRMAARLTRKARAKI